MLAMTFYLRLYEYSSWIFSGYPYIDVPMAESFFMSSGTLSNVYDSAILWVKDGEKFFISNSPRQ